ncbi:ATP-binding cassette domain-containing protein [Serratia marcescens]|uniref:ATP-binding cassette domain-containing protein n=1 Tax=Serratia marcescens TaxID=615 RepID=UPI0020229B31|nr:ATP-binding cassette domain-containing protein [Serratia marcescens]
MSLAKASIWTAGSTLIKIGVGLLVVKLLAVAFGPSGVGQAGNFRQLITVLGVLSGAGIFNGITKYVAEYHQDPQRLRLAVGTASSIVLGFSTLLALVFLFAAEPISIGLFGHADYVDVVRAVAFIQMGIAYANLFMAVLKGYRDAMGNALAVIGGSLLGVVAYYLCFKLGGYEGALAGLALVPEERRKEGIFIDEAIPMNLSVSADDSFSRWSLFSRRQELRWAREIMQRLNIRASGPQQRLARLSGGNQQKVAIGKWLRGDAEVLIFDEPTKGVDIKAKQELFSLIDGLARAGKGVVYASGEFAELVGLCDRICVLWDGRIVAELNAADIDEETLLLYSTGGTPA